MEHRLGSRFPLHVCLELWRRGKISGRFTSNNISHGGIFVSDCRDAFKRGDFVDIKLKSTLFGRTGEASMKALAVHNANNGMGLMWTTNNITFHQELEKLRPKAAAIH